METRNSGPYGPLFLAPAVGLGPSARGPLAPRASGVFYHIYDDTDESIHIAKMVFKSFLAKKLVE